MSKLIRTTLIALLLLFTGATIAYAQTEVRGEIHGAVYEDVNGDGVCVNSGVEGENPIADVNLEFVSSDEATIVNLHTGSDGTYGLVAAGLSIWRVTVKPDTNEWNATSENPTFAYVLPETGLIQTDINFCLQKGGNAVIILPESGAAAQPTIMPWIVLVSILGGSFVVMGLAMEWRRRQV